MRLILTILCLATLLGAHAAEGRTTRSFVPTETGAIAIITPHALKELGESDSVFFVDLESDPLALMTELPADLDAYVIVDFDGQITPLVWTRARQIAALGYRNVRIRWGWGC